MDADVKIREARRGVAEQDGEKERRVFSSDRTARGQTTLTREETEGSKEEKGERNLGRRRRNLPVQVLTQLRR